MIISVRAVTIAYVVRVRFSYHRFIFLSIISSFWSSSLEFMFSCEWWLMVLYTLLWWFSPIVRLFSVSKAFSSPRTIIKTLHNNIFADKNTSNSSNTRLKKRCGAYMIKKNRFYAPQDILFFVYLNLHYIFDDRDSQSFDVLKRVQYFFLTDLNVRLMNSQQVFYAC